MSGPQYGERGGLLHRIRDSTATEHRQASAGAQSNQTPSSATSTTEHDFRFPRRPADSRPPSAFATATATEASRASASASAQSKLHHSTVDHARTELLGESFFSTWKDDAPEELESPDEMQKKDPLATQIWKLYSKTKRQLPNQERMENLTWRMMAMNLRKRKEEEAARYVYNAALIYRLAASGGPWT